MQCEAIAMKFEWFFLFRWFVYSQRSGLFCTLGCRCESELETFVVCTMFKASEMGVFVSVFKKNCIRFWNSSLFFPSLVVSDVYGIRDVLKDVLYKVWSAMSCWKAREEKGIQMRMVIRFVCQEIFYLVRLYLRKKNCWIDAPES